MAMPNVDLVNRAALGNERVVPTRRGQVVAVGVPVEDVKP